MSILEVKGSLAPWLDPDDKKLMCVEFYSFTSENCKTISRPYNILARKRSDIVFLRLNVDKYPSVAEEYQIEQTPTFIFFFYGKQQDRFETDAISVVEERIDLSLSKVDSLETPIMEIENEMHSNDLTESLEMKNDDVDNNDYHEEEDYDRFNRFESIGIPHLIKEEVDSNQLNTHREVKIEEQSSSNEIRQVMMEMGFDESVITTVLTSSDNMDLDTAVTMALQMNANSPQSMWDLAEERLRQSKWEQMTKVHKTRSDLQREMRIKEVEKLRKYKEREEKDRKLLLAQFRDDHNFVETKANKQTTQIEKIVVMIDSIYSQRQYNIGRTALSMILRILENTSQSDPKYRRIRKDSTVLVEKVGAATGGYALLQMAGFVLIGDYYVMEVRDDDLVNGIIASIRRRLYI